MSLESRIKHHIKAQTHTFKAGAHIGFESTLAKELSMLGINSLSEAKLETVWQAIALSRCARSFEMKIAEFHCENFGKLEQKIKSIPWELYLPENCSLNIKVKTEKSRLYHKGAIEERIRHTPPFGHHSNRGELNLHVNFKEDICTIWLDLCGEPLHKRGGRFVEDAPLQESLAASILLYAEFAKYEKLIDPMAGSGVFSLEAAKWISKSVMLERDFDFMKMPAFREAAFNNFLQKAMPIFSGKKIEIFCSDKSEKAVKTITHNAKNFLDVISISKMDFFSLPPAQNALLVLNPPYGKRLAKEKNLYKEITKKIEKDFKGCGTVILYPATVKMDGVQTYNGGLKIKILAKQM